MRTNVARRENSTPLQSVELRMAKSSMPLQQAENIDETAIRLEAVSLFLECLAAIGMELKEACLTMQFDRSLFSKVEKGEARLPFDAMWRLPLAFWVEFHKRLALKKGLSVASRREARMALAMQTFQNLVDLIGAEEEQ
jgi:hypothetical protein